MLPVLESCLSKLNCTPASGSTFKAEATIQTDYLIADVSEREIPKRRCRQAQQEEYSGKKKTAYNQKSGYNGFESGSIIFE